MASQACAAAPSQGVSNTTNNKNNKNNANSELRVQFSVDCHTQFGEVVLLVGNTPTLGEWDPTKAVVLGTNPEAYPTWSATVTLPAGTALEFKYVIKKQDGSFVWESPQVQWNRCDLIFSEAKQTACVKRAQFGHVDPTLPELPADAQCLRFGSHSSYVMAVGGVSALPPVAAQPTQNHALSCVCCHLQLRGFQV